MPTTPSSMPMAVTSRCVTLCCTEQKTCMASLRLAHTSMTIESAGINADVLLARSTCCSVLVVTLWTCCTAWVVSGVSLSARAACKLIAAYMSWAMHPVASNLLAFCPHTAWQAAGLSARSLNLLRDSICMIRSAVDVGSETLV